MRKAYKSLLGFLGAVLSKILGADFIQNLIRDLKSMRSLWCYVILALFVWECIWLVLYEAQSCGNTIIVTTGGIASWIFSNYVVVGYMDRKGGYGYVQNLPPHPTPISETAKEHPDSQD